MADESKNSPKKPWGGMKELSMEMRLLLAFGLMGLVLFGTQYLMPKPVKPVEAPVEKAAEKAAEKAPEATAPEKAPVAKAEAKADSKGGPKPGDRAAAAARL